MKLDLGLRLGHSVAQSRPLSPSVDDCEIPLPLSCLINDGGSGFGDFFGVGLVIGSVGWSVGLVTDQWQWWACSRICVGF